MAVIPHDNHLAGICVSLTQHLSDQTAYYRVSEETLLDALVAFVFIIDPNDVEYVVTEWAQKSRARQDQGVEINKVEEGPFASLPICLSSSDFQSLSRSPIKVLKYCLVAIQRVLGLPFNFSREFRPFQDRFFNNFFHRVFHLAYALSNEIEELACILQFSIEASSHPSELKFIFQAMLMKVTNHRQIFWYLGISSVNITLNVAVEILRSIYDKEFVDHSSYKNFAKCLLLRINPAEIYVTGLGRRIMAILLHAAVSCFESTREPNPLIKRMIVHLARMNADPQTVVWYKNRTSMEILTRRGDEFSRDVVRYFRGHRALTNNLFVELPSSDDFL